MQNIKKQPTKTQRYVFYGLSVIGALGVLRNVWRMSTMARQYSKFKEVVLRPADANEVVSILQGQNLRKDVILQSVLPNFKEKYFECADDYKRFKSLKGNFYQNLELQQSFDGFLSTRKKEYRIQFNMYHSHVSLQLVKLAKSLDEKGISFNKNHPVVTYGTLLYSKEKKKPVFDTKMVALSGLSMLKYFQIHIISIALSTFFYSLLLGAVISIYSNTSVVDEKTLNSLTQDIIQIIASNEIQPCQFYDNLPL